MMEKITKTGIYPNVSIEDYHADKDWLSATGVKHAQRSMAQYRMFLDGYYDDNEASHFDFGNAAELFLVDPKGFAEKVAIVPDQEFLQQVLEDRGEMKSPRASKEYKELFNEFAEENEGKYFINDCGEESMEVLNVIAARVKNDPWISSLLKDVPFQSSLYWVDFDSGLKMKTRPDVANQKNNYVVNIKTTLDASPNVFTKDLVKLGYPLQACMEIMGCENTGLIKGVEKYFWLMLEKRAPFNVQLYEFDMGDVKVVMDDMKYIFKSIANCHKNEVWPGYGAAADNKYGILTAKIPTWYRVVEGYE